MQREEGMICELCKKENPKKWQDFCIDLSCSGRMVPAASKGIRIISKDGIGFNTRILNEAGIDITKEARIAAIDIRIRPDELCTATMEFFIGSIDITALLELTNEQLSQYYPTVEEF